MKKFKPETVFFNRRIYDNPVIYCEDMNFDKAVRELPFNAKLAARLIVLSQIHDDVDYRVELDPSLPFQEQKKQAEQIQYYVDHYRTMKRCGKKF